MAQVEIVNKPQYVVTLTQEEIIGLKFLLGWGISQRSMIKLSLGGLSAAIDDIEDIRGGAYEDLHRSLAWEEIATLA